MLPYPCVGKGFIAPASDNLAQRERGMIKPTSASTSPPTIQAMGKTAGADDTRAADDERKAGGYTADSEPADEPVELYTRERDGERSAKEWNSEVGEWVRPGYSTGSKRALAAILVREALSVIRLAQRPADTPQEGRGCSPPLCGQDDKAGLN